MYEKNKEKEKKDQIDLLCCKSKKGNGKKNPQQITAKKEEIPLAKEYN